MNDNDAGQTNRSLSRTIRDFGALSMGGSIYAQHLDSATTSRTPIVLAAIQPFNLTSLDDAELLRVSPPGNLVSVRSQEEILYDGAYHHFSINRFDYSSLMRLFVES